MTKEEWEALWREKVMAGDYTHDDDYWYVNGYVCCLQGTVTVAHGDAVKSQFRDSWIQGFLDAQGDLTREQADQE